MNISDNLDALALTYKKLARCESGKIAHESCAEATQEAIRQNANRASVDTDLNTNPWQPYRCNLCGEWHIGRSRR